MSYRLYSLRVAQQFRMYWPQIINNKIKNLPSYGLKTMKVDVTRGIFTLFFMDFTRTNFEKKNDLKWLHVRYFKEKKKCVFKYCERR